ncbi:hypothetical protein ACPA9J_11125 [Pseudomonas aeruginosa]
MRRPGAERRRALNYRPILRWTVAEVFAMHDRHGIKPNPLYSAGGWRASAACRASTPAGRVAGDRPALPRNRPRGRVGAHRGHGQQARRVVVLRHRRWARRQHRTEAVEWAKTSRGGKQFDLLRTGDRFELCSSIYGLCE